MPDQSPREPSELPVPAPASQAEGQQRAGFEPIQQDANLMHASSTNPAAEIASSSGQNQDETPQRIPNWLQKLERFLRVIVRLYLGLLVCCAPWYPAAWDNNPLFASSPWLVTFITHGAVRGVV
jgi:hypothetical protein